MSRPFPIRIRTFTVPLAGVALYYSAQIAAAFAVSYVFGGIGTEEIYSVHYGTFLAFLSLIMFICLSIWLLLARLTAGNGIPAARPSGAESAASVPIALGMLGVISLYMLAVQVLAQHSAAVDGLLQEYQKNITLPASVSGYEAILYCSGVGVIVPIIEEIIFRGIILGEFRSTMKSGPAVLASSVVFGAMHMQPIQIGYAVICGLVLGYVCLYTDSIVVSSAIHIIFNLLGGVLPSMMPKNTFLLGTLSYIEIFSILIGIFCMLYLRNSFRNRKMQEE